MSSLAFLVTELQVRVQQLLSRIGLSSVQSLASETRRKHPDVREVRMLFNTLKMQY